MSSALPSVQWPGMDPAIIADIKLRLNAVAISERVEIALAIESGSRAWGFPSPDSDYDVRFIYIRTADSYLSLWPKRDVIELPMTLVLDINGWDLAKALKLMLKGNAVVIEWLTSPLAYQVNDRFRRDMLALADEVTDRTAILLHYRHLALQQHRMADPHGELIRLKKLFYILRPLIACRWLTMRPARAVAPMNFIALCDEADLPAPLRRAIDEQLAMKARTREMGEGAVPEEILRFLREELGRPMPTGRMESVREGMRNEAVDAFFRRWVFAAG